MAHLVFVLCLLAGELQPLDNFAVNGSFEEDRDRDGQPDGWTGRAFDSPAEVAWDEATAHRGRRSLRIRDSFRPGDQRDWKRVTGRWSAAPRPVAPGTEYALELWVKTDGVTGAAYAHLAWQQGSKWLCEDNTERLSGTGDWRKLTVKAVAPEKADAVVVSLCLSRSKGTA